MKKMFIVALVISAALVACGGKKKTPAGPGSGDMKGSSTEPMGSGSAAEPAGSGAAPMEGSGG